ncbi:MAG TPA: hypothetical protein VGK14_08200 [Novimethylophilus sp.]|jgi:hypothetical protein|uniref:hypothetical protein n=1 Tax=Novimethylophilus sp. TaxID=2137426 RepID=UPI002F40BDB5
MKKLLLTLCLTLSPLAAQAGDIFVIAGAGTQLAGGDIRDVFVGEKQFAGPTKLIPLDNAAAQDAFLEKVVKMDKQKYTSTWTKKSFRDGLNQPAVKSSDLEVVEFVKKTPGAVGYVTSQPAGVTVIQKF